MSAPSPDHLNLWWRGLRVPLSVLLPLHLGYRARGMERLRAGGGLILSNHQSFLDPPLIGLPMPRPVTFLARDDLFKAPLVGTYMRGIHVLPVKSAAAGPGGLIEAIRRMRSGHLVCLFPEGARTPDGEVAEFKPGFIALARRAGVPVYPAAIAGAFESMPRGSAFIRPGRVRVVFGDAIPEIEMEGTEAEVAIRVRNHIATRYAEARAWRNGGNPNDSAP